MYLEVVFTSYGRQNENTDPRVGKANAVLREFYISVITKQEISTITKLSVFKLLFFPSSCMVMKL